MSRVVVTGSRGFVAHHTIPALREAGHDVVGFDLTDGQDICHPDDLRAVLTPGCKVLHLAAVSRFAHADQDPPEAYRTNVGGVATLFQVAQEVDVERIVCASTASVYMPAWIAPITEDHPVNGNSHYGLSKALGEKMIGLFRVPFVVLRYAHLYGTHKWHGGLIDSFLERIARGADPILYGGAQSNDFTYIRDVVTANVLALETPHINERFNIGTGQSTTTSEAIEILAKLTGYNGHYDRRPSRQVDGQITLDIRKAQRLLGYEPKWNFRAGMIDMLATRES